MKVSQDKKIIERILTKGVEQILPSVDALKDLLLSGKRLNIYQGYDPTADSLHIGHAVGMRKLEDFRKLGHNVVFLIGDFTARIGDPSDKTAARVKLTKAQVEKNLKKYVEQSLPIIDIFNKENPVQVLYNSQWLEPLNLGDIIEIASEFTVQQMMKRDMFKKRVEIDKPIYLHEFFYPMMQGYDSVMMDIDVEIGGNDQLFNMLAGRDLVRSRLNKEKIVITGKLFTTADGIKMSKSEGSMIRLDENANDIYGKVMAFDDNLLVLGFEILTSYDMDRVKQIEERLQTGENPMNIKKQLAFQLVTELKGEQAAISAQKYFENIFQKQDTQTEIPLKIVNNLKIIDILIELKIAESRAQARRLIEQGAVKIDDEKVTHWDSELKSDISTAQILKCGRYIYQIKYISK